MTSSIFLNVCGSCSLFVLTKGNQKFDINLVNKIIEAIKFKQNTCS